MDSVKSSSLEFDDFVIIPENPSLQEEIEEFKVIEEPTYRNNVEMLAYRVISEGVQDTTYGKFFGNVHRVFSHVKPNKVHTMFAKEIRSFFNKNGIDPKDVQEIRDIHCNPMIAGRFKVKKGNDTFRITVFNFEKVADENIAELYSKSKLLDRAERTTIGFNTSTDKVEAAVQVGLRTTVPGILIEKH